MASMRHSMCTFNDMFDNYTVNDIFDNVYLFKVYKTNIIINKYANM